MIQKILLGSRNTAIPNSRNITNRVDNDHRNMPQVTRILFVFILLSNLQMFKVILV